MRSFAWLLLSLLACLSFISAQTQNDPSSDSYTCSSSSPCKVGCCSKSGYCGFGPSFCGQGNCTSSCDQKSECDAGWGAQWSNAESCPLKVCCSQYGFCGTTQEFCGSATVPSPSCGANSGTSSGRIIGYYEGWAPSRSCEGLLPEDISYMDYTHLNYAFAYIDPNSYAVAMMSASDAEYMPRLTALKNQNPGLKVWISIGGWSMNDPDQPTKSTFSNLAGSSSAQSAFFSSLISFMQTYGFDGVDIDWEYPVAPERSGNAADFANYPVFLRNLRNALGSSGHNYGLTITLPSSYWYMRNFDIVNLEPSVDWFNVMTYDLHGTWDSTDPYIGPYIYAHTNLTEIDQTMQLLWRNSIDPAKVSMGLGFYGRSFTLSNPSCNTAGCPFSAGGNPGPCTQSSGTLSYEEIEDIIAAGGANVYFDQAAAVKEVTWGGNQWVSYDDVQTLQLKTQYANSKCLGGVMVWAASTDDAQGTAANALSGTNGRANVSLAALSNYNSALTSCIWGPCGSSQQAAACPPGTAPAQRSDSGSSKVFGKNAGIYTGCPKGSQRNFCCPTDNMPTCQWRGTAPACGPTNGCKKGEIAVASDLCATGHCCSTDHKNLCCTLSYADTQSSLCIWEGSAPLCSIFKNLGAASCPSTIPIALTYDKDGAGGEQACGAEAGFKTLCCPQQVPYQNCGWQVNNNNYSYWPQLTFLSDQAAAVTCNSNCPSGQRPIAGDSSACNKGTTAFFCCDDPTALNSPLPPTDSNLCPVDDDDLLEQIVADPDDPSDLLEATDGESDCYISGVANSGDTTHQPDELKRRGEFMDAAELLGENVLHFETLDKRGRSRTQTVCKNKSGSSRNRIRSQLTSQPYQSVNQLRSRRNYYTLTNPAACTTGGVTAQAGPSTGVPYVTEHVWEIQGVRQFVQTMLDGILPGGGTLSQGQIPWSIFDNTNSGAQFFAAWPSNVNPSTGIGNTPMASVYSTMGTNSDITNTLILAAIINAIKEHIWAGYPNIVSPSRMNRFSPAERLGVFQRVFAAFQYMNNSLATQAFSYVYRNQLSLWQNFGTVLNNAGITYDVGGAFTAFTRAQFARMGSNAQTWIQPYLQNDLSYWQSNTAARRYGATVARTNAAAVAQLINNLSTWATVTSPA